MAKKTTINVTTHPEIVRHFREAAASYGGRLGLCLTAAMVLFLEADPETQAAALRRVFDAELRDQVSQLLNEIQASQAKKVREKPNRAGTQ